MNDINMCINMKKSCQNEPAAHRLLCRLLSSSTFFVHISMVKAVWINDEIPWHLQLNDLGKCHPHINWDNTLRNSSQHILLQPCARNKG